MRRNTLPRLLLGFVLVWCAGAQPAIAQPAAGAEKKIPPPENIALKTRDGVQLAATFYGSAIGKEAVPVLLVHQYKGSRADYQDLAKALQAAGHAVLVPDLRGHGQSMRQLLPTGKERELDLNLFGKADIAAMVEFDLEKCKSFLMEKNNLAQLNIDKLCVVGAEMGAVVAVNWAMKDWNWPVLATGKQGQDVKALVLLSPTRQFKGLTISPVLTNRDLVSKLSWLIVVGDQEPAELREAKDVHKQLDKWLPEPEASQAAEKKQLFFFPVATTLQGTKILTAKNLNLPNTIMQFIDLRLVKKTYPWTDRKSPL